MPSAAHMGLLKFADRTVGQGGDKLAGEIVGILVVGIDDVADLRGELPHRRIGDPLFGELRQARLPVEESQRHADGRGELRRIGRLRRMLDRERLPQPMDGAFPDRA